MYLSPRDTSAIIKQRLLHGSLSRMCHAETDTYKCLVMPIIVVLFHSCNVFAKLQLYQNPVNALPWRQIQQKHVLEMNWGGEKRIKRKAVPGRDSLVLL